MDLLTLKKAMRYAEELVQQMGGDVTELAEDLKDLADKLSIEDLDSDTAVTILINALRQHQWQNEADALVCEEGQVTLTNTQKFPFNDSLKSVALVNTQKNTKYAVIPELISANGNAGEVTASEKQVNGFKLAFSGSATTATVKYIVIGGIIA